MNSFFSQEIIKLGRIIFENFKEPIAILYDGSGEIIYVRTSLLWDLYLGYGSEELDKFLEDRGYVRREVEDNEEGWNLGDLIDVEDEEDPRKETTPEDS